jgi:hypothetical protein
VVLLSSSWLLYRFITKRHHSFCSRLSGALGVNHSVNDIIISLSLALSSVLKSVVGESAARKGRWRSTTCLYSRRHTSDPPAYLLKCRRMAEVILLIAAGSFGTLSAAYAAASPEAFGVKEAQ